MNAWGSSWGSAWGSSFGATEVVQPVATTTGGSGVIKPIRKRQRLPTSWDGTKSEPAFAAPVENEEALLLLL